MPWNFGEIDKLCREKSTSCPNIYRIYLVALSWKHLKTEYHAQQAQRVWDEFKSAHPGSYEIGGKNQEWCDAYYASFAETEATIHALNEEVDIIAQIVNQLVLGGQFEEEDVTVNKVLQALKNQNLAPYVTAVAAKMEGLRNNPEFEYIHSFCNVTKHRSLVKKGWRAEGGENIPTREGVRFQDFDFKPRWSTQTKHFFATWISDINTSYRNTLTGYIREVGNALAGYLRSLP